MGTVLNPALRLLLAGFTLSILARDPRLPRAARRPELGTLSVLALTGGALATVVVEEMVPRRRLRAVRRGAGLRRRLAGVFADADGERLHHEEASVQQRPEPNPPAEQGAGWRPPPVLRAAAAGAAFGSVFGFLLGLMSLNRPIANALVFYVLCGLLGAVLAAVAYALGRGADKASDLTRDEH